MTLRLSIFGTLTQHDDRIVMRITVVPFENVT